MRIIIQSWFTIIKMYKILWNFWPHANNTKMIGSTWEVSGSTIVEPVQLHQQVRTLPEYPVSLLYTTPLHWVFWNGPEDTWKRPVSWVSARAANRKKNDLKEKQGISKYLSVPVNDINYLKVQFRSSFAGLPNNNQAKNNLEFRRKVLNTRQSRCKSNAPSILLWKIVRFSNCFKS
jgi:hypothetical protein